MKYDEKRVYKHMPKGWKVDEGAYSPLGTVCISNGKSRFKGERKMAYLVKDEKLMIERIAHNRLHEKADNFVADETSEKKIRAEMRRQKRELDRRQKEREKLAKAHSAPKRAPAKTPAKRQGRSAAKKK